MGPMIGTGKTIHPRAYNILYTPTLSQLKLSLEEKLQVLDGEILDLVKEDDLAGETKASDEYCEGLYAALVRIGEYCAWVKGDQPRPQLQPNLWPHPPLGKLLVQLPKLTIWS